MRLSQPARSTTAYLSTAAGFSPHAELTVEARLTWSRVVGARNRVPSQAQAVGQLKVCFPMEGVAEGLCYILGLRRKDAGERTETGAVSSGGKGTHLCKTVIARLRLVRSLLNSANHLM